MGIQFDNEDDLPSHPIQLILGAGDIARFKTIVSVELVV